MHRIDIQYTKNFYEFALLSSYQKGVLSGELLARRVYVQWHVSVFNMYYYCI